MRIGITTFGADAGRSGIGQYAIQMVNELTRFAEHELHVMVRDREESVFLPDTATIRRERFAYWPENPMLDILAHQLYLGHVVRRSRCDVLFLPAGNRRLPFTSPCPTVGAVHDLSSFHVDGKYDGARMLYIKKVLPRLVQRLTRVITISENSRRDIVRFTGVPEDRVIVTPLAHDARQFYPRDPDKCRRAVEACLGIRAPYILYTSRLEHPGKNHERLIRAFARAKRRGGWPHKLVLAGPDWNGADYVRSLAATVHCGADIVFPGFVPRELLPQLYAGAEAFVFPSLYEGFGMPILEAMASGVPVACSSVSSMPEVGGPAALYFDPRDEEAIEGSLHRILGSGRVRDRLVAGGIAWSRNFSWAATARRTMEVLEDAAGMPRAVSSDATSISTGDPIHRTGEAAGSPAR